MTPSLRGRSAEGFNWNRWVLGLAQSASTTPSARRVVERVVAAHFPLQHQNDRYRAALRAIASPSSKTVEQAEQIAREALRGDTA